MTRAGQPPIVLVHGCGGSAHAAFVATGWLDAFAAAGREAVAVDLPGHGRRDCSRDPQAYSDLAGALLQGLPAGEFDAVGFSLGAKLMLEIAWRAPGRVRRMVLGGVGDNVFAPEAIGEAAALALERGPTADTPPPVLAFLETWEPQRNDARAVAAVLRRPPNPLFTAAQLTLLDLPILLVNGAADPVASIGDRLQRALRGLETVTLPGVGHFDLTAQSRFIQAAVNFLDDGKVKPGSHVGEVAR